MAGGRARFQRPPELVAAGGADRHRILRPNGIDLPFFFETTNVGGFTFNPGAPNYSFNFDVPGRPNSVTFTGAGILNNSSSVPRFSLTENNALLSFRNSSTAANASINMNASLLFPARNHPR
jgi:hypothetical protein